MSLPLLNVPYLTSHAFQAGSQSPPPLSYLTANIHASVSPSLESKLRTLFSQMGFFPTLFDFCLKTGYCFYLILENRLLIRKS